MGGQNQRAPLQGLAARDGLHRLDGLDIVQLTELRVIAWHRPAAQGGYCRRPGRHHRAAGLLQGGQAADMGFVFMAEQQVTDVLQAVTPRLDAGGNGRRAGGGAAVDQMWPAGEVSSTALMPQVPTKWTLPCGVCTGAGVSHPAITPAPSGQAAATAGWAAGVCAVAQPASSRLVTSKAGRRQGGGQSWCVLYRRNGQSAAHQALVRRPWWVRVQGRACPAHRSLR